MNDLFELLFSAAVTARRKGSASDIAELLAIVEEFDSRSDQPQPSLFEIK